MIDPIVQCAVAYLDFGGTQLSVKLGSAPKDFDNATHIHCCFCHGENIPSVRCLCAQQKKAHYF